MPRPAAGPPAGAGPRAGPRAVRARRSPVLHSPGGGVLHAPLLVLARQPLASLHRVEDLLGLALGQILGLGLRRPLLRRLRAAGWGRRIARAPAPALRRGGRGGAPAPRE